jgi:hypothetical protein
VDVPTVTGNVTANAHGERTTITAAELERYSAAASGFTDISKCSYPAGDVNLNTQTTLWGWHVRL